MMPNNYSEFKGLRAVFWPIHNYEIKKFLPMGLMMFCALFNYTIVRDLKDAMIVKSVGADTISFIKFWVVLPCSILFVLLYNKLSNILSKNMLFNIIIIFFLTFFWVFGFYLYPNRESILLNQVAINALLEKTSFPFLGFFIKMHTKWILVVFYLMAELWGSVVVSLLFWQFANSITSVKEAKRFYALFGLFGSMALLLSGQTLMHLMNNQKGFSIAANTFEASLKIITVTFILLGIFFMFLHHWITKYVMRDPRLCKPQQEKLEQQKLSLSVKESIKMIFSNRYLMLIFFIVVGYGISINLVESTWKKMIDLHFLNERNYAKFMGQFSFYTGLTTILFIIIGQNIVRLLGWYKAALITPVMILLTGSIFYSTVLHREEIVRMPIFLGIITNPVILAIWAGQIQNILCKATKYSLFDPTKEMTYIPLDDELRTKGKAAIDVIGARLGKSSGSLIQMTLFAILAVSPKDSNAQLVITPYLFGFLLVAVIGWLYAVRELNKAFTTLVKEKG